MPGPNILIMTILSVKHFYMKRGFDFLFSLIAFSILILPMFIIAFIVRLNSKGPVLYWSDRVGQNNKIFKMPKFRTMRTDTPEMATHLMNNPEVYLTSVGKLLRKSSLDELPQLWSVLKGDMSFVGPRPALFNQDDLIDLRTKKGVHQLVPGITGWAQINGRDELPIPVKVSFDEFYFNNQTLLFDLKILWMTFAKVIKREGVSH